MKVAAAEEVRCSMPPRSAGVNAAKQERANADTATVLAEEKRKARDAITQAHEAMQEAKRLQAEANAKYAASRGFTREIRTRRRTTPADAAQKGAEALQRASSGYERIPIERSQLHHTGQQSGEPPNPHAPAWGGCSTSNRLPPVATGAAPWAAKRSEQRGGAGGHPLQAGPGRSAWPRIY